MRLKEISVLAAAAFAAMATFGPVEAHAVEVRLAKQFGVSYLPLTVMQEQKLLEKAGKEAGIDITTKWLQFTGGTPMNEALISSNLDFASGGVGPLLTIWSRTNGNLGVKGVACINTMPIYLNTIDPKVKTIADFPPEERIALPAVRVSIQAITLQMAAAKAFGEDQANKLDDQTVSMSHPDGLAAMMSGKSEITAHFTSPPYQYQELEDKRVHKVLSSFDVLGGPHTFNCVWSTESFRKDNPKVIKAFLTALDEALTFIKEKPSEATKLWMESTKSKLDPAMIEKIVRSKDSGWTMVPTQIMTYANFMAKTGLIDNKPEKWSDVFVDEIHDLPGS